MRSELTFGLPDTAQAVQAAEWRVSDSLVGYQDAVAVMAARAAAIAAGREPELIWLLEHPPLYTAGTSAHPEQLLDARFPVFESGRGGQMTYHGPGQRVAYVMLDLKRRGPDVRRYVATLEEWIIRTLSRFDVRGERREDRIGVWVRRPDQGEGREDKIAALGIRVQRWVTLHGIAINVDPQLSHFSGILPCGVSDRRYGVTSLCDLGLTATLTDLDVVLRREFEALFGPTADHNVGKQENTSPGRRAESSASAASR
jgi:lipoyl(octanoyl) transferase